MMNGYRKSLLLCGVLLSGAAAAQGIVEVSRGEAVERHLPGDQDFRPWARDPGILLQDAGDRLEKRLVEGQAMETVKLTNVIAPIRFDSGVARISDEDVGRIRRALEAVQDRPNVRLHLVGHADNQRLSGALAERYGDNAGLSRERAGEVAELLQKALNLPAHAISYEWAGDTRPVADNNTAEGRARNRRVEVEVWYDRPQPRLATEEVLVQDEIRQIKVCRMETLCSMRFREGESRRTRVKNLVPALRYSEESVEVTPEFLDHVRKAFANLRDKPNVTARFIGFADDAPLSDRNARIYGDATALSKARAHRVALAVQEALGLPASAVESDGRGATTFVAANDTAQGRALNRRIEVQFWHDDPLQELPEEPQLCPDDGTVEVVTKVYTPSWGSIAPLALQGGEAMIPAGYAADLKRAMADIDGRKNVRLRFRGYTANQRLDRRTADVYGDDIGLSAARARRAMEAVRTQMQLAPSQAEHEGRGFVQSTDVVNEGFIQGQDSFVVVEVVYDEPAIRDDYEGVDITRLTRELRPRNAFGLNLMHISVDGIPLGDPDRSSADVQRCTDVELDRADIQFQFDGLKAQPRLMVAASPEVAAPGDPVRFGMYSNYAHFIKRAEVRIFDAGQSTQALPLAVVTLDEAGRGEWQPELAVPAAGRELQYVLRAYDGAGIFDDTTPRPLWLVADAAAPRAAAMPAAYGESMLERRNIRLAGNTVAVRGSGIPAGHSVWVAGREVPVDARGAFAAEEIMPNGLHTVEVAVLDPQGNGRLYFRELQFEERERFYVGMADLTVSGSRTSGAADLLQGENPRHDYDSTLDGRLAFYGTQTFGEGWRISASADTREGPVKDLFSNFLDKSPDALFRRIDPDYHMPTFGDDSVVEEMAPTLGKLFLKLQHGDDHMLWGSFSTAYVGNELAQVDRGLYGANMQWRADSTTRFGERRASVGAFAAEPGTVAGRDEFRGTGGSLFYLRNQDILTGSERLRVELRDRDSGLVTGVVELRPTVDYDIDYLQGRVLLAAPLASSAGTDLLVRSGDLGGDEAWLVARYEYSPGFDEINTLTTGGEGHAWITDYLRVGLTGSNSSEGAENSVLGADVTLRMSTESWVKVQGGRSEGLASHSLYSMDGGYGFAGEDPLAYDDASADGWRADVSIGAADFITGGKGRLTLYTQRQEAGYSAPGLATLNDRRYYGGTVSLPIGERFTLAAKGDRRAQALGLQTAALELNANYKLGTNWSIGTGVRADERRDYSSVVPLTQQLGSRTDAVLRVGYDAGSTWRMYGFAQETLSKDGDREDNARAGVGGSVRLGERLRAEAEVSGGDLGTGARFGTSYLYSDQTTLYVNYALENERADSSVPGRRSNLVSGVKRRLSDSSSVYFEERFQDASQATGLTHAAGMSLAMSQRWNFGANAEVGVLEDSLTGAETRRKAGGVRVAFSHEATQISSGIEYRSDDSELPDATRTERSTWLFRNNFKVQMTPDWRLVGKLDHSLSDSSQGQFYDGRFTEGVIGFGFRPVLSNRVNALAKYTYFYNVPTTSQVTLQGTAAQFIQKSHIGSVDVTVELAPRWSVGGKYAYRLGALSMDREDPQFFDNRAQLVILRSDLRFGDNWEAVVEGRMLDLPDFDETRSGALLGVYRRIGQNVKAGVGYNFTDFSEDLTDLSYRHQGAFLNIVGAF